MEELDQTLVKHVINHAHPALAQPTLNVYHATPPSC